jgi:hypothetical protein
MKTNNKIIKGFKSVDYMRQVRDQISKDIYKMNFNEIQNYFRERRLYKTIISGRESI